MQTVNEVRLAILQNFLDDVSAALQDESDPEDLRWRIGEIEGTYRSALEAAMPKVGDAVVVERACIMGDTELDYVVDYVGASGAVGKIFNDGVVLRGSTYFASYNEVALEDRG